MVRRICTYPLSISHNSTALHSCSVSINDGPQPYSQFETSSLFGNSKNMLTNQHAYLRQQRAKDQQPKMFDQAYIMRVH